MTILNLSYDLSFEDLYCVDGLRKIDSYFIEYLLKISPDLCNRMLIAREKYFELYKSDESNLIIELAPHLENFIANLFDITKSLANYQSDHLKLNVIYECNKQFIQRHVLNSKRDFSKEDVSIAKTALMMYDIVLPNDNVLQSEIDMARTFLSVYEIANKGEESDWKQYHVELLKHIEIYCLWAIFSIDGQKAHAGGALFKIPQKLDYNNLIPNLYTSSNSATENIVVTKIGRLLTWILFTAKYKIPTSFFHSHNALMYQKSGISNMIYAFSSLYSQTKNFFLKNTFNYKNFYIGTSKKNMQVMQYRVEYICSEHIRERNGFGLNDDGITPVQAIHEANYCLYCHNRDKDSCSKGMQTPNGYKNNALKVELHGCPLQQKISEMHLLKKNHNIIGALATIMIDNPMVAATGHRICNDCMKACIFQKQTPVNTPSVESKILQDVLFLPFGFEIYSLLSKWNPLNFQQSLPKEINHYKVLITGMGPAGFTLAHYLLNAGVNVIGVDGLKIEPLDFLNVNGDMKPIHDIQSLFEKLEYRRPSGFGGVMEYGITARWNKNMLNIVRLLLLRRQNFQMYDGVRFGSNLTYDFCEKIGIDHIALAVGAGKPNLPKIKNLLTKGVRMSSDFLMSLHSSGAYRQQTITSLQIRMPIVVIGSGLTAIDTATEAIQYYLVQIRRFLQQYSVLGEAFLATLSTEDQEIAREFITHAKQLKRRTGKLSKLIHKWGGVTILYRKTLNESPAYRINHEELAKGFEEGIQFVENATPIEIVEDSFGYCKGIIFEKQNKQTFIPAKAIIIATGTQPNRILDSEDSRLINNSKVTYFGDANERYNGSVVKAMASAKNEYKNILKKLSEITPTPQNIEINTQLHSYVKEVIQLTPNVLEIIVESPLAAVNFKPGQFFRLQKYESNSKAIQGYRFPMEGIALTGANVSGSLISLIVLEIGLSSKLCEFLQPGEKVVLMGPTGIATDIPRKKNVILIGGGLGNAVLFSIGKKMRENGCNVIYFAGYKTLQDRFKQEEIEEAADTVIWCCEEGLLSINRESDLAYHGNLIQGMEMFFSKNSTKSISKMIVIGSSGLMAAVANMRKNMKLRCSGIASVNSPMQCMMKEICAQCIQRHTIGSEDIYIYSCANQDQNIDTVDFEFLGKRLQQNSLLEKTAKAFFEALK